MYFVRIMFRLQNTYYNKRFRWYVPCSVKHPRRSCIFRLLSVELWIILIKSFVTAVISTTFVGRYSGTWEWQGYKSLRSLVTNVWAVILVVSVSQKPRVPSLYSFFYVRYFSPGCVSFCPSDQCSRHFSKRFLLTPDKNTNSKHGWTVLFRS